MLVLQAHASLDMACAQTGILIQGKVHTYIACFTDLGLLGTSQPLPSKALVMYTRIDSAPEQRDKVWLQGQKSRRHSRSYCCTAGREEEP